MSKFLDQITIKNRVRLLIIFAIGLFFIFSIAYFSWAFTVSLNHQKTQQIEYITETALGVLKTYSQEVKDGKMTLKEAQEAAKEAIASMRFDDKNYIWINDYNGIMVMHPAKPELNGKDLNDIKDLKGKLVFVEAIKLAKEKNNAEFEYYWAKPGENPNKAFRKLSYVRGFNDWHWLVAAGVYVDDIEKEITKTILQSLGIDIVLLVIIFIVGNATIGKSIVSPLEKLTQLSLQLSQNNLSVSIEDDNNKTEIGELNRSFKKFVNNFLNLIKEITSSAEDISASSEEMSATAEQTANGAQQTSTSTTQLAQGANEISVNVEKGVNSIDNLNKSIQEISKEAVNVSGLGNETEKQANVGAEHVKKAVHKIDSIKHAAGDISVSITVLGKLSKEIEEIVDLIKSIAGQTNLLALNAAIEAARAGEHGKGFAVVADEVKKLAGQSAEATEKITGMIKEIQNKTNVAISTMDKATQEVEEGVLVVNDAGTALEKIILQVKAANNKIQDITQGIEGIADNSENLVQMIENISAITQQTAAGAEEISSITLEQSSSIKEISTSSQTLAQIAEKLINQVSVFKL